MLLPWKYIVFKRTIYTGGGCVLHRSILSISMSINLFQLETEDRYRKGTKEKETHVVDEHRK
jgi:hypothetical protein